MFPLHVVFRRIAVSCFALLVSLMLIGQAVQYNVADIIPAANKSVLITEQVQQLIDDCYVRGGGTLYFPAGEYLVGTLQLKDNIFLELGPGATLYGSTRMEDYPIQDFQVLIYAKGAGNFGITGKGTINGQGDSFWRGKEHPIVRPERLILFEDCHNIRMQDFILDNSPNWNLEIRRCEKVWIDGISIFSERKAPNTDGIDPVSSKDVFISNCYIDVGDDCICPKSRGNIPTENLVVTNCILISDDSAIKLGTRSEAPIRNLVFSNIVIRNTEYGIAFFAKDGGTFENIRFSNIHIETTHNMEEDATKPMGTYPIFIDIERRNPDGPLSYVRNIFFSDITIDSPDGHCLFLGQLDGPLEGIHLNNIHYTLQRRSPFEGAQKPRGVRSLKNKAPNDFAHISAHFAFAYVDGLTIKGLTIDDKSKESTYERHMLWANNVHNVKVREFSNRAVYPNMLLPQFHFRESTNIEIRDCSPAFSESPFLLLEGQTTKDVLLMNNDFRKVGQFTEFADGFSGEELLEVNNVSKSPEAE